MKVFQANSSHIDQVVNLFDAYRVWYRKPSDKVSAKAFLLERMYSKESVIYVCENDISDSGLTLSSIEGDWNYPLVATNSLNGLLINVASVKEYGLRKAKLAILKEY